MELDDLDELHYITHIDNVASILHDGILSHTLAASAQHISVADPEVQARRARKRVPTPSGTRALHTYANLYISARNPMLYRLQAQHADLCVMRVARDVLRRPGAVVADCNAASDHVSFRAGERGLAAIDRNLVFAEYWTDPDPIIKFRKTSAKCAEVLVPERVPGSFIFGAYVSSAANVPRIEYSCELPQGFDVSVNRHLFFR